MRRILEAMPHYIAAVATIWLAIFAYKAWNELIQGTEALQDQLKVMQMEQRPLMWIVGLEGPDFSETARQIAWRVHFANIGKGIAYQMVLRTYTKIGPERYQTGRHIGIGGNAVELEPTRPTIVPPDIPTARLRADVFSRSGIDPQFYAMMLRTDLALGVLIEFDYTDASGEAKFSNAVCIERFASGAIANVPPEECRNEH